MRREFSAGGLVVREQDGRWWLAVIRPRRDDPTKEVWALPKGHIDTGESPANAAVREVFEETGLRAEMREKLGDSRYVYTWDGERIFKIVSFFLLTAVGGEIGVLPPGMELEVAEARWIPLAEAQTTLSYGGERQMAARATARLDAQGFQKLE
jgi:8-oxo-dGTP pyrophosphatase MutT (NUDIX family)